MERDEIAKYLSDFVDSRMENEYSDDKYQDEPHEESKRHKKYMKKLIWNERHFGSHLWVGTAARRVAVVVVVLVSLAAANSISANVFNFDPWKQFVLKESDMTKTSYEERDKSQKAEMCTDPVRDIPGYVPEGYQQSELERDGTAVSSVWKYGENTIGFQRTAVEDGKPIWDNSESAREGNTLVNGYKAKIVTADGEVQLRWEDRKYGYLLFASNIEVKEILEMAESIYSD